MTSTLGIPATLADDVSRYLRDLDQGEDGVCPSADRVVWNSDEIVMLIRQGVEIIGTLKPGAAKRKMVDMPLSGGGADPIPDECIECLNILGIVDDSGRVIPGGARLVNLKQGAIGLPSCGSSQVEVAIDGDVLRFDPAPKPGSTMSLLCKVDLTPENLPQDLRGALFLIVASLAFGMETESVQLRERSNSMWLQAMQVLGVRASETTNAARMGALSRMGNAAQ